MRLLFDDAPFRPPVTGVGRYAIGLVTALKSLAHAVHFDVVHGRDVVAIDRLLAADCAGHQPPDPHAGGYKARLLDMPGALAAWKVLKGLGVRGRGPFDLYHALNFQPACRVACPVLPLVHDLAHLRIPDHIPRHTRRALRPLGRLLAEVPLVQTVSEFTKREIVDIFGVPPHRVIVIPAGVGPLSATMDAATAAHLLRSMQLESGANLLLFGGTEPAS